MKITYDPEGDILTIRLGEGRPVDSEQVRPGLIVDYDAHDNVLGLEIYSISKRYPPIDFQHLDIQLPGKRA